MTPTDKNDILMAHMFLVTPEFLRERIAQLPELLSSAAIAPEFLSKSPKVSELVSQKAASQAGTRVTEPIPSQKGVTEVAPPAPPPSAGTRAVTRGAAWVFVSERGASDPLPFPEALAQLLTSEGEQGCLRNLLSERRLSKSFVSAEFSTFTAQLEQHLEDTSRRLGPQESRGLRVEAGTKDGGSQNEMKTNEVGPVRGASRREESQSSVQSQVEEEGLGEADGFQTESREGDYSGQGEVRGDRVVAQGCFSEILDGYRSVPTNFGEIFAMCEGAGQFMTKIKQDNFRFFSQAGEDDSFHTGGSSKDFAPPPPPPPRPVHPGTVFTPNDFKGPRQAASSLRITAADLMGDAPISLPKPQRSQNPYEAFGLDDYAEPPRAKAPRPSDQLFKEAKHFRDPYAAPFKEGPSQAFTGSMRDQVYNEWAAGPSCGGPGPPSRNYDFAPPSLAEKTGRISQEDFGSHPNTFKYPSQFPPHQSQKHLPKPSPHSSNPYMNSHFELDSMNYTTHNFTRSQTFTHGDTHALEAGSRFKQHPGGRNQHPQAAQGSRQNKVYTKRS